MAAGGGTFLDFTVIAAGTLLFCWAYLAVRRQQRARRAPQGAGFVEFAIIHGPDAEERQTAIRRWPRIAGEPAGSLVVTDHELLWFASTSLRDGCPSLTVAKSDIAAVQLTPLGTMPDGVGVDISLRDGSNLAIETLHGHRLADALMSIGIEASWQAVRR
jgi:hypothetical protein